MTVYYVQEEELFQEYFAENVHIKLERTHPFIVASQNMNWDGLIKEVIPIVYKDTFMEIGRYLDIRCHCGIYLLQSFYNWTDRFSEEMLVNHGPTRVFCGISSFPGKKLDHTRIEKFRNQRLGKEGAEILSKYILHLAKRKGFTNGKIMDIDSTVQEAGIAYPTEMGLMKKFRQRVLKISEKVLKKTSKRFKELVMLGQKAQRTLKEYQFFSKDIEKKRMLIEKTRKMSYQFLKELKRCSSKWNMEKLRPSMKKEVNHLLNIMPKLLKQIHYWIKTGEVAKDKILSLHKAAPKFIKKGKIGKSTEIGRKVIVNQYTNGFLNIYIPENPNISEHGCIKISLENHLNVFGEKAQSIGADRGMYSKRNIKLCRQAGVEEIGLQPRGKAKWQVGPERARELYCRRAKIEARISGAGRLGLKKSRSRTDTGDAISAIRAITGFNLRKLVYCING